MSQIWRLPFAIPNVVEQKASLIKLVVFDVDGVLTNGSVSYDANGEEYKSFNILDGQGIKLVMQNGIQTAIASARSSSALTVRAKELGINYVEMGCEDKRDVMLELRSKLKLSREQCCFVGDDLLDIPPMLESGLGIAVQNAHFSVKHVAHWTTPSNGGAGAVREVCDVILYAQKKLDTIMDDYMKLSTDENP